MSDSFVTLWTVACQAALAVGFPRQEYWSRLLFASPGDLPNPGIKPASPALQGGFFLTTEPPGKPSGRTEGEKSHGSWPTSWSQSCSQQKKFPFLSIGPPGPDLTTQLLYQPLPVPPQSCLDRDIRRWRRRNRGFSCSV